MNVIQGCIEDLISLLLEVCFGDAVEPCALGGLAFCGRVHRDVEFADRSDDVFGHLALVCFEIAHVIADTAVYFKGSSDVRVTVGRNARVSASSESSAAAVSAAFDTDVDPQIVIAQHDTQDAQGTCVVVAFALEVSTECHVLYLAGGLEGFVFLFKVIHNAARLHFVGVQILFECCDFFFQRCVACLVCGIGDGEILFAEDVFHQGLQIFNQFCFFLIEVLVQIF